MSTQAPLFNRQDLVNRVSDAILIRLADDDKSGSADEVVISAIIRDASSVVWSFLPVDYEIPESGLVPDYLKKLAVDIGQAQLYGRFPQSNTGIEGNQILARAMVELERFAGGLTNVPEVTGTTETSSYVTSDAPRGSFSR